MIELRAGRFLVTGGTGFIGSALVRALVRRARTSAASTTIRAAPPSGLATCSDKSSWSPATSAIRPRFAGRLRGMESVCHLAYINGTEFFYDRPELILEVAVKGMMNVLDALPRRGRARPDSWPRARRCTRMPPGFPTPRTFRWSFPTSPIPASRTAAGRSSASCSRSTTGASTSTASSYSGRTTSTGRTWARSTSSRSSPCACSEPLRTPTGTCGFPFRAPASETRAFIYIDDFTEALMRVIERGEHLNVYNIGGPGEVTIANVAQLVAACFGREIEIVPGKLLAGQHRRGAARTSQSSRPGIRTRDESRDGNLAEPSPGIATRFTPESARVAHGHDCRPESRTPPEPAAASSSNGARCAARRTCGRFCSSGSCRRSTRWTRSARVRTSSRRIRPSCCVRECTLVQLGLIVDPAIIFPPHYAYTSGTTRILRENFAELYREVMQLFPLAKRGSGRRHRSNDGTLSAISIEAGHRVCGVEPTNALKLAVAAGIPTVNAFFGPESAEEVRRRTAGRIVITAANVFAHIEDVHEIVDSVLSLLADDGLFISESHYLAAAGRDAAVRHGLPRAPAVLLAHQPEVPAGDARPGSHPREADSDARRIDSRVCRRARAAARQRRGRAAPAVEESALTLERFAEFRREVSASKLDLLALLHEVRRDGSRVYAVGAPSRASTLVNYVGLDDSIIDCVLEIRGSYKIGKYMPGTLIPVLEEQKLFEDQPEYALLFSWHIGDELAGKLRQLGFRGKFMCPLPTPRIL